MKLLFNLVTAAVIACFLAGCNQPSAAPGGDEHADAGKHAHDDHDHHDHGPGPHGGTIAEWGDGDYHLEFTVDHDKQEAVVYVLGGDAKTAAPVKAASLLLSINEPQVQVDLVPQPLEGEADGTSSRFVGSHESLGIAREFAGTITAEVNGTPYSGDFTEEAEGHKH